MTMAFDFPAAPTNGQTFRPPGGPTYVFQSPVWQALSADTPLPTAQARNHIVNPAFQISQDNGNTTGTTNLFYLADQWLHSFGGSITAVVRAGRIQSDATAMRNRGQLYVLTAQASLVGSNYSIMQQDIEGLKITDLRWGLADAKSAVLRFTVRSNLAGTFAVALRSGPVDVSFVVPFTINAGEEGAFVERTVVIPAPLIGTFASDATKALVLSFVFACGPSLHTPTPGVWVSGNYIGVAGMTNGVAAVNNYLEIANVGLYLDPDSTGQAPPWEEPDEAEELAACQRYYQTVYTMWSGRVNATAMTMYAPTTFVAPCRPGSVFSGVSSNATNFPATTGTLVGINNGVREQRVSNASTDTIGVYSSGVTINGRL